MELKKFDPSAYDYDVLSQAEIFCVPGGRCPVLGSQATVY